MNGMRFLNPRLRSMHTMPGQRAYVWTTSTHTSDAITLRSQQRHQGLYSYKLKGEPTVQIQKCNRLWG